MAIWFFSFTHISGCELTKIDKRFANGSIRVVESEGVEYSYQNFLNSLTFTTQILVRSQRVDIGPYIERLSKLRRDNDNMLLGVLIFAKLLAWKLDLQL